MNNGERLTPPALRLTPAELATVQAMAVMGPYVAPLARALHIHGNTVKYRLMCVREKYGMEGFTDMWQVFTEGVRRGDVVLDKGQTLEAFATNLAHEAQEAFGHAGGNVAAWIHGQARDWLGVRKVAA